MADVVSAFLCRSTYGEYNLRNADSLGILVPEAEVQDSEFHNDSKSK